MDKIEHLWNTSNWTAQARYLIEGIKTFPKDSRIILILRHSHRENSNDIKFLGKLGITDVGRKIAYKLGENLPLERFVRIFHSPSPRCKETANKILEGFTKKNGKCKNYGAISPLNNLDSEKDFITTKALKYGGDRFVNLWRSNYFSVNNLMLFSKYCIQTFQNLLKLISNTTEGGLDIHVSHDLFIIALRLGWFDMNLSDKWVSFLGGFAFSIKKEKIFFIDIGKKSIEKFRILNYNKIPIFIPDYF